MKNIIIAPNKWQREAGQKIVFLAGSIAMGLAEEWQAEIGNKLADIGIMVLNPRRTSWDASWVQQIENDLFREQVEWELQGLEESDWIIFYFAPDTQAPITLLELGLWARSGKCVVCCPDGFWRKGNVDIVCARYQVPQVSNLQGLYDFLQERIAPKVR
jgi:hypothetical protein